MLLLFLLEWSVFIDIPVAIGTYAGLYLMTKPRRRIGGIDIDFIENGEELEQKLIEAKRRRSAERRSREDDELWNNWRNYGNHPLDRI